MSHEDDLLKKTTTIFTISVCLSFLGFKTENIRKITYFLDITTNTIRTYEKNKTKYRIITKEREQKRKKRKRRKYISYYCTQTGKHTYAHVTLIVMLQRKRTMVYVCEYSSSARKHTR